MKRFLLIFLILFCPMFCLSQETADNEELKKEAITLYNLNKVEDSLSVIMQIPEKQRDSEIYLIMGNIAQDLGKEIDANFLFQKAILTDEKNYKAYYNLGNLYLKDDRLNMAIANYKKAIKNKPDFAYAYYNLGCSYLKQEEYRDAKNAFLKAILHKNTEPDFYYNLSYSYKMIKKNKKAEEFLKIYDDLMKQSLE